MADFDYSQFQPNEGESFDSYYNRVGAETSSDGWINASPNSIWAKIDNFFTGKRDSAYEYYQNWYNQQSLAKQQQYEYELQRALRSTQYQDVIKSMQAAGLNPYAMMSGQFGLGNSSGTSTQALTYQKSDKSNTGKTGAVALIYMIGRIIAAMM